MLRYLPLLRDRACAFAHSSHPSMQPATLVHSVRRRSAIPSLALSAVPSSVCNRRDGVGATTGTASGGCAIL
jgi:hypothetical protein